MEATFANTVYAHMKMLESNMFLGECMKEVA